MTLIHRRELLLGAGAAGLASLPLVACAGQRPVPPVASSNSLIAGNLCPMTPEQTEGPFYFDPQLVRADIAEGKAGIPLRLRLQIVDAAACAPSRQARVDIWHCDAAGVYSGYDRERTDGQRWLRGTQFAGTDGVVTFNTIFPGWYEGRATHIHLKAWMPDGRAVTSQLYFDEGLNDAVYRQGPYAAHGGQRQRNAEDFIFRDAGEHVPMARVTRGANGLDGALVIALS